ncbi:MAG: hypothetical protein WA919_20810 [Coleofasciculaceae cyanobacterium]
MHEKKFTTSKKVEQTLESQQSNNLWSAIPDIEAEQVGGGQLAGLGNNISPYVEGNLATAMQYAGGGTALGMEYAEEGMLAGLTLAQMMAAAYPGLIEPSVSGLTGGPSLDNFF